MSLFISALVAFITAIITSLILYRLKSHVAQKDNSDDLHRLKIDSLRTQLQSQETADENHHTEHKGAPLNQPTHRPEPDSIQTTDEPKASPPYSKHQ
ncbi:hypothetical protein BV002_00541 [Haemophilus influenzae]|uniref:hypothetical protein n=1 Tax=Haemophilus influenzae TaxID=727 RepID=UPI000D01BF83|nr:hypothetical protein [Haemophilus influenzae]PRM16297.1 hypothetical protein BV002_00541 [Haemophilus influenzae]